LTGPISRTSILIEILPLFFLWQDIQSNTRTKGA